LADHTQRYSPIIERTATRLPSGGRVAVWVVANVEHYRYGRPIGGPGAGYDISAYGTRDYGNRAGFGRLMPLLDEYGIRYTVALNLECYRAFPEIMRFCEDRRLDIICHGYSNTDEIGRMSATQQADYMLGCQEAFVALTGRRFAGWFSPAGGTTEQTLPAAGLAGLTYMVGLYHDDLPTLSDDGVVVMPYAMDPNDGWTFRLSMEGADFERAMIDYFDQLYDDGAQIPRVFSLPLHPFVLGHPHRIRHARRILDHVLSKPSIWVADGSEIARWHVEQAHHAG